MSNYLGFQPTDNPIYYFVSYNSEDAEKVGIIAKAMSHSGINLWYDHGIEYGDNWENVISEKIRNSQAMILFFTKGILQKSNSYVQKEYKMATRFFNRKVYVVMLDEIHDSEIPTAKVSWWIDINENQCVTGYAFDDPHTLTENIASALGIQSHEDKMNKVIDRYNELYHEGRLTEAEVCLSEYLHGISLEGKVRLFANVLNGNLQNVTLISPAEVIEGKLPGQLGYKNCYIECKQITVNNNVFTCINEFVFHRGERGDAHRIRLFKNGEDLHTVGGLVEVFNLDVFWDSRDDIIYITYESEKEINIDGKYSDSKIMKGITTIEDPNDQAVCTDFKYLE